MTAATYTELPLFAAASRVTDPDTSRRAGEKVRKLGTGLHARVLEALRGCSLTDRELEQLAQFQQYGPSTVRKRRSELYQAGHVVAVGERNGLTLWTLNPEYTP